MPTLSTYVPRSDLVSSAGRAAHDVGAAALLGGNLFGRVAMHPALREVSQPRERGSVTNRAWRRYGLVTGMRFNGAEPNGAVPLADGSTAAPEATAKETRAKRTLNALGAANLTAEVALVAINSALAQTNFRRPPLRRLLRR
jgi:hypothetical protein